MKNLDNEAVTWLLTHKFWWEGEIGHKIVLLTNNAPGYVKEFVYNNNKFNPDEEVVEFDWDSDTTFSSEDISSKPVLNYSDLRYLGF